ncbi:MAG: DUF6600 domain-containing protein [Gemmatimonadaceae bacterium]
MRGTRVLIGMVALLASGLATVNAQDQNQDPSARVLRASLLQGEVSFRPGNVDDWSSATLNYPLTTGDHLWTNTDARAELHVGANAIRLAPETAFEILDLDDNHLQIRLTQGSALIRLRTLESDDNIEIDTPSGAVTLMRDGTYRVDVSTDGATSTITTRNGDAEVTANGNTVPVRPNQTVLFTVDGASPDVREAAPFDEYDSWAEARDRTEDQSVSAQYVSRDMTGYEDLDRNGSWSDDPDYGHVWAPTHVVEDWAPYRYGRWAWVEPYGWTWIDDAPWGFAPFHYGRWAYVRERWVWAPGEIRRRPVYAPALVVFEGGSSFSGDRYGDRGDVAWFPLAPNEVYRPAYHVSDQYVRRVNVTNVNITNINITNVNVTNITYRNRGVQGATTAVGRDQFAGSRRIGRNAIVVPVDQARSAHIVGDGAPVTPTQQSVLIRRQGAPEVRRPPEATQARQVVWKNSPPPRRATFQSHAAQLTSTDGKPVEPLPISQTRGAPRSGITRGAPNTTMPPVPNTRPNINVRSQPSDEQHAPIAQPNSPRNTNERPVPTMQPNVRPVPSTPPNTNVRPVPTRQPNVRPVPSTPPNTNVRPVPGTQPRTDDRPMHTDGPAPVNGSPNGSPAHTIGEPNWNARTTPNAQPASVPNARPVTHTDAPPPRVIDERRSPVQGEMPQATQPQATQRQVTQPQVTQPPPKRQTDERAASDGRRVQTEEKQQPKARDDKPPRRY